jgi:MFS family permease
MTGPIADWFGNRLVLLIVTLLIVAGPLAALAFVWFPQIGVWAFPAVFTLVGLTPVAQKTFNNYTLEITTADNHPRYLSTLSLCMAAPIYFSPLVGVAIKYAGFEVVYLGVSALLLAGWLLSFGLTEPREPGKPVVLAEDSIVDDSITE